MCDKLRAAFLDIFLAHPEVRCLGTTICWNGNLNDARIHHGLWLGQDGGPVQDAASVIGSTYQTLKLLDEQMGRGMQIVTALREQAIVLSTEVIKQREELEKVRREWTAEAQRQEAEGAKRTGQKGPG